MLVNVYKGRLIYIVTLVLGVPAGARPFAKGHQVCQLSSIAAVVFRIANAYQGEVPHPGPGEYRHGQGNHEKPGPGVAETETGN